jgi:hypothetical protein
LLPGIDVDRCDIEVGTFPGRDFGVIELASDLSITPAP